MERFIKFALLMCFASLSNAIPWVDEIFKTGQRTLVQCRRRTGVFERPDEDFGGSVLKLRDCLRAEFVDSLDDLVASPEIPVSDYVSLIASNTTAHQFKGRSDPDEDLLTTMTNKMYAILDTHSVKLNLASFDGTEAEGQVEGRRRRFRQMFPMIVAGFMLMAAFVVPLGFQFMAMIGGKALLLSKLAFFSALYSGYRRVTADLDFHHHHPEPFHHHMGFHHRQDTIQPQAYQFVRT